jgi:hypothetical protein
VPAPGRGLVIAVSGAHLSSYTYPLCGCRFPIYPFVEADRAELFRDHCSPVRNGQRQCLVDLELNLKRASHHRINTHRHHRSSPTNVRHSIRLRSLILMLRPFPWLMKLGSPACWWLIPHLAINLERAAMDLACVGSVDNVDYRPACRNHIHVTMARRC